MAAKCFTEDQKRLMIERVRHNETGIQNKKYKRYQFIETLTDPVTWLYVLLQLCGTLIIGGTFSHLPSCWMSKLTCSPQASVSFPTWLSPALDFQPSRLISWTLLKALLPSWSWLLVLGSRRRQDKPSWSCMHGLCECHSLLCYPDDTLFHIP